MEFKKNIFIGLKAAESLQGKYFSLLTFIRICNNFMANSGIIL